MWKLKSVRFRIELQHCAKKPNSYKVQLNFQFLIWSRKTFLIIIYDVVHIIVLICFTDTNNDSTEYLKLGETVKFDEKNRDISGSVGPIHKTVSPKESSWSHLFFGKIITQFKIWKVTILLGLRTTIFQNFARKQKVYHYVLFVLFISFKCQSNNTNNVF